MAGVKGSSAYYNTETREVRMFLSAPGDPWVKGRPPEQKRKQSPELVAKRAESMRRRLREKGPTEKELEGYRKLSKIRKEGNYSPSAEVRERISKSLTGRPQVWEENKSRASARRKGCDIVYVLKVRTKEGTLFGKWGSTRESSFVYREKEFRRQGFSWEVVYWKLHGQNAEHVEALIGREMNKFPLDGLVHFPGYTETFEWNSNTEEILEAIISGLD